MDVRELLIHLRATPSDRQVARETKTARLTVIRYRKWAKEQGLLTGALPPMEELQQRLDKTLPRVTGPQNHSSVEGYRDIVVRLREQGVEMAAIHARLQERGFEGSYSAVFRFVRKLEPHAPDAVVRVERAVGEEAQVDFGEVSKMLDPTTHELRRTWAFVMTLSWSRHAYVEFFFDQRVQTWLLAHVHAFAFFGGSPRRVTTDNLKAAVIRAAWDNPEVNQAYRECAEHYGFLIAPCRPRTPEHKGKVESGVHYVQRNFMGGRDTTDIVRANQEVRDWCLGAAGERRHGTTREAPIERFLQTEQAQLRPVPAQEYDLSVFKHTKLHRDCYIVFEQSYYSAPFRLVGAELLVRAGLRTVRLYDAEHRLIATHERAKRPGERHTHPDHLPPQKLSGLQQNQEQCLEDARAAGPCTLAVVDQLVSDPVVYRVPTAARLIRLALTYSPNRLEAACARALHFGDPRYSTIKRILLEGLESDPYPANPPPMNLQPSPTSFQDPAGNPVGNPADIVMRHVTVAQAPFVYARGADELLGHLLGGTSLGPAESFKSSEASSQDGGAAWN